MNGYELDLILDTMTILYDTREQDTPSLRRRLDRFGLPNKREKFDSGDYSAEFSLQNGDVFSLKTLCVIERKMSVDELCGNLFQDRERFERELQRLKEAGTKCYLTVENCSWEKILRHDYISKASPMSVLASITAFMARYDLRVLFCSAETFPILVKDILKKEARERLKEM